MLQAHLWTYSVLMKLGPCLVLTVLTCWLLKRLWEAERHHQSLATRLIHNSRSADQSIKKEKNPREINDEVILCHILTIDIPPIINHLSNLNEI